jgi:hypothetical protein
MPTAFVKKSLLSAVVFESNRMASECEFLPTYGKN